LLDSLLQETPIELRPQVIDDDLCCVIIGMNQQ